MNNRAEAIEYAMSLLKELDDYGFDRSDPSSISKIDLPSYISWNAGCTRVAIWNDNDENYVVKMPFRAEDEKYCQKEVELYGKAVEAGVADYFGWCVQVLAAEENYGIGVYAMEYLDCDEETVDNDSFDHAYKDYCERFDLNPEDDETHENFLSCYWDDDLCSDAPLEFLLSKIPDIDEQCRVSNFVEDEDISDLHSGNFGYRGETLVMIDYASYGW